MQKPTYRVMHTAQFNIEQPGYVIAQYNDNLRDYVIPPYEEQGRSSWATVFPTSTNAWRFLNNQISGIAFVRTRNIPERFSTASGRLIPGGWVAECENPTEFGCFQIYSQRSRTEAEAYYYLKQQLAKLGCTVVIRGDNVDYLEN